MKHCYFLLLALAGCGQSDSEHQAASVSEASKAPTIKPTIPVKPADTYTSGDREVSGPNDTLHVGNGLVLQLKPGSKSDFAKAPAFDGYAEEASYLKAVPTNQVHRDKHALYLTLANGKQLRLTDNTYDMRGGQNEKVDTGYQFHGSFSQLPYWMADSSIYEGVTTLLIHKQNGSISRLWSYPVLSPDKQHIFVNSQGIETAMAPNGLQLFDVSAQKITPKWERILEHWEPYRVHWLDNKTLAIEQRRLVDGGLEKLSYVRLILPN